MLTLVQRWFADTRRSVGALVQDLRPEQRRAAIAELDVFFRHVGRLLWLVASQKRRATAELTWGVYEVLVKEAPVSAVATVLSEAPEEREEIEAVLRHAALTGLTCKEMPNYVRLECPRAVFELLAHEHSLPELERELKALNELEKPQIRVNSLKTTVAELGLRLEKRSLAVAPGRWAPLALRLLTDVHTASLPESDEGLLELQMEGAQLATLLVEPEKKSRILDMCAGAGSKTL